MSGGSAFPKYFGGNRDLAPGEEAGMTLRDYFAAHAPAEPQHWFRPVVSERPRAIYHEGHGGEHCWDCSPENYRELEEYDAERRKLALVQWPYAWADAMLAERAK